MAIKSFIACTVKWTPRWCNKPKFHFIMHLEDHVRRFGPAVIFATEIFESHNAIIRSKSVHSNRQAPSRNIATAFAHMNRLCAFLCGGKIRVRSVVSTSTARSSGPTDTTENPSHFWQQVGVNPTELMKNQSVVTGYLGINTGSDVLRPGLSLQSDIKSHR